MPQKTARGSRSLHAAVERRLVQLTAEEERFLAARTPEVRAAELARAIAELRDLCVPDVDEAALFRKHHPEAERWERDPDGVDDPDDRHAVSPPDPKGPRMPLEGRPVTNRCRLDRLVTGWLRELEMLPEWRAHMGLAARRRRLERSLVELSRPEPTRQDAVRRTSHHGGSSGGVPLSATHV